MARRLSITPWISGAAALAVLLGSYAWQGGAEDESPSLDRGRYLVAITGCNDCHTPGFGEAGGQVPEQQWLIGDQLGFRGPWGTTYPANVRLLLAEMSE